MRYGTTMAAALIALTLTGCVVVAPISPLGGRERLSETTIEGEGRDKILLVDVRGVISDRPEEHAFGLVEEESMLARVQTALDLAAEDDRVRAVVVRIDSPGGGVTASDQLYQVITEWKREYQRPVIASLGDVAASGGYYVACAADTIVAHPTSVTGSIGVIMTGLNLEGLLGKLGVKNQTFKAGAHKDMLSPLRDVAPEERRMVQRILDTLHARFVSVVRENRPRLDPARAGEMTDGRVVDAQEAKATGLIDDIGTLRDAIALAQQRAGLSEARVVTYVRGGNTRETIWATPRVPSPLAALGIDAGALGLTGPRFMYLWAPGLAH